jgi:hypothetical protein
MELQKVYPHASLLSFLCHSSLSAIETWVHATRTGRGTENVNRGPNQDR